MWNKKKYSRSLPDSNKQEPDVNNDKNTDDTDYPSMCMCIGMCLGLVIGQMIFDDSTIGMCVGMCIGLAVGMSIKQRKQ